VDHFPGCGDRLGAQGDDLEDRDGEIGIGLAGLIADAALSQRGVPYVWGGKTTSGFDCSGLAGWAYRQGGISSIPMGTAHNQWQWCTLCTNQRGALLFFDTDYNGIIDGEFNQGAINAVKAFQKRNHGKETGVLNLPERAALAAALTETALTMHRLPTGEGPEVTQLLVGDLCLAKASRLLVDHASPALQADFALAVERLAAPPASGSEPPRVRQELLLALDCEMCTTEAGFEVTRVTLVD